MRPTSLALHKIHFLSSLIPISTLKSYSWLRTNTSKKRNSRTFKVKF